MLLTAVAHRAHFPPVGHQEPESSMSTLPSLLEWSFSKAQVNLAMGTPSPCSTKGQGSSGWAKVRCKAVPTSSALHGQAGLGSHWRSVQMASGVNEPGCAMCAAPLEFCSETPWETQSMYYLRWLLEADANVSLLRSPKYPVLLWCVACVCSMYVSISHANKRLLSPFVLCSLIMRTLQPLSVGLPLQMLTVELR